MQKKRNLVFKLWANPTHLTYRAMLWLGFVLFCVLLSVKQWAFSSISPIETDILQLLPKNEQSPIVEQAFQSVANNLNDQIVFAITSKNDKNLNQAASYLDSQLKSSPFFSNVKGTIDKAQQEQWAEYFFSHRYQFLSKEQRIRLSKDPKQQVDQVVQQVFNPFSGVTGEELTSDPFLLFREYLSQLNKNNPSLKLKDGFLHASLQNQNYILISAKLSVSPYGAKAEDAVKEILQLEQKLKQDFGVESYHAGVLFYANFGVQSAKAEISTIGLVSLLGVVFLLLCVFRSPMPLFLALLSIGVGLLCALSLTILVFGRIHLFSLVFGASLIGVSIDYAFHYFTERLAAGAQWNSEQGLKHIFVAITLGLITSLVGYLGLLVAPFSGLQQLSLFSAIGLTAAYATVVCWYPLLARQAPNKPMLPSMRLWQVWFGLWSKKAFRLALPLLVLGAGAGLLTHAKYDDDIRQLQALPDQLTKQEALISALTGYDASSQMLLVTAQSEQALLARLEDLDKTFNQWQIDGVIQGYQSISQFLSSVDTQQRDFKLIKTLYQNQGNALAKALSLDRAPLFDHKFTPVSLDAFLNSVAAEPVKFLYLGEIKASSGKPLFASVVTLGKIRDASVIRRFADQHKEVFYLNKAQEISELFSQYRVKVLELVAAALLAIFALIALRYRIKHALLIITPSVIACVAGIGVSVLFGSTLNLFNLLALVLILGIGVDYTLFFAEKKQSETSLLAISLSAITTLLSFGLLSLSNTHAIHSFGVTVLGGIFVAWLLAPLAIYPHKEKR